jgi:hypothetical protein
MKTFLKAFCFLSLAILVFAFSVWQPKPTKAAIGSPGNKVMMANYSAASGAVKYSAAQNVLGYTNKTIVVSGVTLSSSPSSVAYQNMSGTVVAQCAPTSSGPWATCPQGNGSGGAAASLTTNGVLTWTDAIYYVRLKWTASTTGHKIKAWLTWY